MEMLKTVTVRASPLRRRASLQRAQLRLGCPRFSQLSPLLSAFLCIKLPMTHLPGTPQPHKHSWARTHTHTQASIFAHAFKPKSSLALTFLWPVFCLTEGIKYDHTSPSTPRWHTPCVLKNRWVCPRRLVCEHIAGFCSTPVQLGWKCILGAALTVPVRLDLPWI